MMRMMKEKILSYMREEAHRPLAAEELAAGLMLRGAALNAFWSALAELESDAKIIKNRSGLYGLPEFMNLVVGRLDMTGKGYGFVIPEAARGEADVFVPGDALGGAMHGDRVVARVALSHGTGRSREGEIIRVVSRANEKIVGTFTSRKSFGFVTPDNAKLCQEIFVPRRGFKGAKNGTKVVVKITRWPRGRHGAEGEVEEVIGKIGAPGVDIVSVMKSYGLSESFPEEAAAEAASVPQSVVKNERRGRRDLRGLPVVTVDGDDSKDFDDAVFAKRTDGGWMLGVYIADVSWYVREGSALDREALKRGTSVYLADRVIPMLPFELSNGICSLNAGEDRLAIACEMELSKDGEVTGYELFPALIRVRRRLTYSVLNKILVENDPDAMAEHEDILPMLRALAEVRDALNEKRKRRGAIEFEIPEVKVILDGDGHPVDLIKRGGSLSESVIEECMLAANETVARHMANKNLPSIYRVHEEPTSDKISGLNALLALFGQRIRPDRNGHIKPMDVQRTLKKFDERPEERLVSTVSLRSMQQARYSVENIGHFALAADFYTHFTSPIRRYPDLVVHRILRESFRPAGIRKKRQAELFEKLAGIAEHSSARERLSTEAERETTKIKEIEFMTRFVGETFTGTISGVTAFGVFVELQNGVEGLVHVSRMTDDYYEYVEEHYALVGALGKKTYRLGDSVKVELIGANVLARSIDFVFIEDAPNSAAQKKEKSRSGAKKKSPAKKTKQKGVKKAGKKLKGSTRVR